MNLPSSLFLLATCICFAPSSSHAQTKDAPADPVYLATSDGWLGLFGHGDEYARYSLPGKEVQFQDPYHVLLRPGLGMVVTFADRKAFSTTSDLLSDHAKWELDYWRSRVDRAEAMTRVDLSGPRQDLRVTQMKFFRETGEDISLYMIALAAKDGVFVLSISPGKDGVEALVTAIARSVSLVGHPLDAAETAKISGELKAGAK